MPLSADQKKKIDPALLKTLTATGEAIIAAKIPPSMAYALRDGVAFDQWPDDAIEATARLMREMQRRLIEAATEIVTQARTEAGGEKSDPQPSKESGKTPPGHRGRHGRGAGKGTSSTANAKPPTDPATTG